MDEKLEKYRNKVRREQFFSKIKQRLIRMVTFPSETKHKKDETIEIPDVSTQFKNQRIHNHMKVIDFIKNRNN